METSESHHQWEALRAVCRVLELCAENVTAEALAQRTGLDVTQVEPILGQLEQMGLARQTSGGLVPIAWWTSPRIELFLNVPSVSEETFQAYCRELDLLAHDCRRRSIGVVRPYLHETALEILLGVSGGLLAAEIAKMLLRSLQPSLDAFTRRVWERFAGRGIDRVTITADSIDIEKAGLNAFRITVTVSSTDSPAKILQSLESSLTQTVARPVKPPLGPSAKKGAVFLSHSSEDKAFVRALAARLVIGGISVWFDECELRTGDSLRQRIEAGLRDAAFVIVVLSPRSVDSVWVNEEIDAAYARQLESRNISILPVLLQDCEIPALLRGKVRADFRAPDQFEAAAQALIGEIKARGEALTRHARH